MALQILINGSRLRQARYVTWTPSPCVLRVTGTSGVPLRGKVRISNGTVPGGGRLVFYRQPGDVPRSTLTLNVPLTGGALRFWVGGRFGSPSRADGDTSIVVSRTTGARLLEIPVMVRIRKNANNLTPGERDRFVAALARLNNQGGGPFRFFRDMHVFDAVDEAHFDHGFLPWHRAYLMDLERELQAIDGSVALPYWRFDAPAANVFTPEFLGSSNAAGTVQFSATNPLQFWATDGVPGVSRTPLFNTATSGASRSGVPVRTEAATLALGQATGSGYATFRTPLEGDPHGAAHVSFGGFISDIGTAARDPLFFLLHGNVDRLWAKWQWTFGRFDRGNAASFTAGARVGHRLPDSMWPWNGTVGAPRPATAPGGGLASSMVASAPSASPAVGDMLDYQGVVAATGRLGFDYDDVPYQA